VGPLLAPEALYMESSHELSSVLKLKLAHDVTVMSVVYRGEGAWGGEHHHHHHNHQDEPS
jgi:hypothetical protein